MLRAEAAFLDRSVLIPTSQDAGVIFLESRSELVRLHYSYRS